MKERERPRKGRAVRQSSAQSPTRRARATDSAKPTAVCPVVGVGASAGGLEALTSLLNHLPTKTGMAFALVQHLDPNHASHLSEILSRATPMPVMEAEDGVHLEPDRIYVIPPNASMSIADGTLRLGPRAGGRGRHFPIDHFFQSLAAHRGNKAIGVVLSGNATDGTLGLQAIKAAGGIAFAQDETSAKFPSMPHSAIATGSVDFILPPEEIAGELARLGDAPYVRGDRDLQAAEPSHEKLMAQIFALLRGATEVDFSNYRQTTIQRRISRRMIVQRVGTLSEYLDLLEANHAEVDALFRDILIHVTNFFREPAVCDALAEQVFAELVKNTPEGGTIRIWIPGCATGEEAYSLAICLMEFLESEARTIPIQIFGTDVSDAVIETARKGVYDAGIEANVSPERLRRFFKKLNHGYQINKVVRDQCVFARQNVVKDPPFSKVDLISCRNVLIYFEPTLQKKLMPVFHYALKRHGYLLLGSAETITAFGELFVPLDTKNKIFMKRATAHGALPALHLGDLPPDEPPRERTPLRPEQKEVWTRLDVQREADRLLTTRFCPPGLVIDDSMEIIQLRGEVALYLDPAPGEPTLNVFRMTHPALAAQLRSAIIAARKAPEPVRRPTVRVEKRGAVRHVDLEVIRMDPPNVGERCFIVLFRESERLQETQRTSKKSSARRLRDREVEAELAAVKEHLQALVEEHEATNEELRSANEEIQSSNEELQSTNEELQTAKEELQSTNEELTTLNEELNQRNIELNALNDDLNNLLRSVALPVVMLGRDLRIRRFTPGAQKIFKLIESDIGRPITDIKTDLDLHDLEPLLLHVIDNLGFVERELRDKDGRWHRLQVRPYETGDNKISGAVLILFDIDVARRGSDRLQHAFRYADSIVEAVREPLLVLDAELRVKRATRSFRMEFCAEGENPEGRSFYEICGGKWDNPKLRKLLGGVLSKSDRIDGFEFEHNFRKNGTKRLLLNVRCVPAMDGEERLLILSAKEANS